MVRKISAGMAFPEPGRAPTEAVGAYADPNFPGQPMTSCCS